MNIILNGEQKNIADDLSVMGLIESLSLTKKRIAIELNQNIVVKSKHKTTTLKEGDKLEIIHAVGGG
ncbi:Sulfur carrier protein ThiS [hydrothermal vent metagenome]|uniref:Sulfur carrier protein ThiS n=1 Tax=hydrothermal vent metagenome TaxID=652676 RepID=A0A1W1CG04_9ZZZZ